MSCCRTLFSSNRRILHGMLGPSRALGKPEFVDGQIAWTWTGDHAAFDYVIDWRAHARPPGACAQFRKRRSFSSRSLVPKSFWKIAAQSTSWFPCSAVWFGTCSAEARLARYFKKRQFARKSHPCQSSERRSFAVGACPGRFFNSKAVWECPGRTSRWVHPDIRKLYVESAWSISSCAAEICFVFSGTVARGLMHGHLDGAAIYVWFWFICVLLTDVLKPERKGQAFLESLGGKATAGAGNSSPDLKPCGFRSGIWRETNLGDKAVAVAKSSPELNHEGASAENLPVLASFYNLFS